MPFSKSVGRFLVSSLAALLIPLIVRASEEPLPYPDKRLHFFLGPVEHLSSNDQRLVGGSVYFLPLNSTLTFKAVYSKLDSVVITGLPVVRREAGLFILEKRLNEPELILVRVTPYLGDEPVTNLKKIFLFVATQTEAQTARVEIVPGDTGRGIVCPIEVPIEFEAKVSPPYFSPLMEWKVNGNWMQRFGGNFDARFTHIGKQTVSAGAAQPDLEVQTYRAKITNSDILIPEGSPVTFWAETDPPGFEAKVRWYAETIFGTCAPKSGKGETFTTTFLNSSRESDGLRCLWIYADNAIVFQDGPTCSVSNDSTGTDGVITTSSQQNNNSIGFCIRVPSFCGIKPCGQIKFTGCTATQLADFAVLPEQDGVPFINPLNNGIWYDTEGFWHKHHLPKTEWLKVPGHCDAEVICEEGNEFTIEWCCNLWGIPCWGKVRWTSTAAGEKAKIDNPF